MLSPSFILCLCFLQYWIDEALVKAKGTSVTLEVFPDLHYLCIKQFLFLREEVKVKFSSATAAMAACCFCCSAMWWYLQMYARARDANLAILTLVSTAAGQVHSLTSFLKFPSRHNLFPPFVKLDTVVSGKVLKLFLCVSSLLEGYSIWFSCSRRIFFDRSTSLDFPVARSWHCICCCSGVKYHGPMSVDLNAILWVLPTRNKGKCRARNPSSAVTVVFHHCLGHTIVFWHVLSSQSLVQPFSPSWCMYPVVFKSI